MSFASASDLPESRWRDVRIAVAVCMQPMLRPARRERAQAATAPGPAPAEAAAVA
jgi:hypothetical protein